MKRAKKWLTLAFLLAALMMSHVSAADIPNDYTPAAGSPKPDWLSGLLDRLFS